MKKMKSGMMFKMYKQGDIITVPFPFSDLSEVKQRPALVLSKDSDNKSSKDILICGITSNIKEAKHSFIIGRNDLEEGFIPRLSRIKVDKIFTVKQSTVKKKIARINNESLDKVKAEFSKLV